MTLDEAIITKERVAKQMEKTAESLCLNNPQDNRLVEHCLECAREQRQLVAWLKELKDRRNSVDQKN